MKQALKFILEVTITFLFLSVTAGIIILAFDLLTGATEISLLILAVVLTALGKKDKSVKP